MGKYKSRISDNQPLESNVMKRKQRSLKKLDIQTFSIFILLAVLTFLFVLGTRWMIYAPEVARQNQSVPSLAPEIKAGK